MWIAACWMQQVGWRRRARLLQALVLAPVAAQGAHVAGVGGVGAGAAVQLLCQALKLPLPRLPLLHQLVHLRAGFGDTQDSPLPSPRLWLYASGLLISRPLAQ
jgi:hypothetical protein